MKKIFLAIVILVFTIFPLLAQEVAPTADTTATETTSERTATNDNVSRLDYIVPKFPGVSIVNDNMLQNSINRLTNYVSVIRDDYLFRVVYKVDKIVERYTNDYHINTNDLEYIDFNLYNVVLGEMASDNNVALGIKETTEALNYLESVKSPLLAIGKTNDVEQIDYHLNLYAGILNMYNGSRYSMRKALNHFNYLLDSPVNSDDTNMYVRINTYIASLNYELISSEFNNDVVKKVYYNDMFDAIWNIVDAATTDETVKEAKFLILINQFYTVIFTDTQKFQTVYSKYFDKLGYNYGQTEENILEQPVRDEYKDTTTTDETTAAGDTEPEATE